MGPISGSSFEVKRTVDMHYVSTKIAAPRSVRDQEAPARSRSARANIISKMGSCLAVAVSGQYIDPTAVE